MTIDIGAIIGIVSGLISISAVLIGAGKILEKVAELGLKVGALQAAHDELEKKVDDLDKATQATALGLTTCKDEIKRNFDQHQEDFYPAVKEQSSLLSRCEERHRK